MTQGVEDSAFNNSSAPRVFKTSIRNQRSQQKIMQCLLLRHYVTVTMDQRPWFFPGCWKNRYQLSRTTIIMYTIKAAEL